VSIGVVWFTCTRTAGGLDCSPSTPLKVSAIALCTALICFGISALLRGGQ